MDLTHDDNVDLPVLRDWDWCKPMTVEMEFTNVDPEVLALLTGTDPDGQKPAAQSMEVWADIDWKWRQWQWWLQRTPWRRPKRQRYYYLPNVKIEPRFPETR